MIEIGLLANNRKLHYSVLFASLPLGPVDDGRPCPPSPVVSVYLCLGLEDRPDRLQGRGEEALEGWPGLQELPHHLLHLPRVQHRLAAARRRKGFSKNHTS